MINNTTNSKQMIEVFIIDHHQPNIDVLRQDMNEKTGDINIIGEATSVEEALPKLELSAAKVIILGNRSYSDTGVDSCVLIKNLYPDKKVIFLSEYYYPDNLFTTLVNNTDAILHILASLSKIKATIHSVIAGRKIVGSGVLNSVINKTNGKLFYTQSEQRLLKALSMGFDKKGASRILNMSYYGVDFHCRNLLRKFKTKNISHVIEQAKQEGLLASSI